MKINLLEKMIAGRNETLAENITVCAAASLAGTFYAHEFFYEHQLRIHTAICLILTAVIAAIWLICAFHSGRNGKVGFAVFTVLYWGVPFAYTLFYASRDNLHGYNKWLAMLNKAVNAVLCDPFDKAAEKLSSSPVSLAAVLALLTALAFTGGTVLRIYRKKHDNSADNGDIDNNEQLSEKL